MRAEVVLPLCRAVWGRDQSRATIDHERANPSGVVNLKVLRDAGNDLQMFRAQIVALTPLYVAARHHGFTKWQDEGVCVAEANRPEGLVVLGSSRSRPGARRGSRGLPTRVPPGIEDSAHRRPGALQHDEQAAGRSSLAVEAIVVDGGQRGQR